MLSMSLSQRISLNRLRQMRANLRETLTKLPRQHDNSMRSAIQGVVCLRRIKHAGLIGKFYWRKDRLKDESQCQVTNADWSSGMLNYDAKKEQPYLQLMRQEPDLYGGLDFAQLGMAMGMEIDCFSSFLAGSVKDETAGGYQLKQAFVEIPAPAKSTALTLTSLKTIAQTIISMPVMVTQSEVAAPPQPPVAKKRVRKVKSQVPAAQAAQDSESVDAVSNSTQLIDNRSIEHSSEKIEKKTRKAPTKAARSSKGSRSKKSLAS